MSSRSRRKQAARAARPQAQPAPEATPAAPELTAADRWMGALCYLGPLWLIPACSPRRRQAFVQFHLNQGLVLLVLVAAFIAMGFVPYCYEFAVSCAVLVVILALIGLAGALRGNTDSLPVIKNVTRNFHPF